MNQPTPDVSQADVDRIMRRDFPSEAIQQVLAVLAEYGKEDYHREIVRVQLAVLKLADGSIENLHQEIQGAKCDYRDILSYSEYPNYTKRAFSIDKLSYAERKAVIDADWKQYNDWLAP
ncbi:MAG: hypothetical protein V4671_25460 [Armatimonadota bacterium]